MMRTFVACAATAALTIGLMATGVGAGRSAAASAYAPACPQASYGADGNMGPVFCMIDNPVALKYFAPMAKRTFALGPNATPNSVQASLVADFKHGGTLPILCSIYQLATWRNHWRFPYSMIGAVATQLKVTRFWCSEPKFAEGG